MNNKLNDVSFFKIEVFSTEILQNKKIFEFFRIFFEFVRICSIVV